MKAVFSFSQARGTSVVSPPPASTVSDEIVIL